MDSRIKILIFDMDGVILDSEPLHETARQIMYEKYDIVADESFPDPVGKSARGFWKMVGEKYGRCWDIYQMEEEQFRLVAEQVESNHTPPTKGLLKVLEWGRKEGIKIGLASSSARLLVDRVLAALKIAQYFDVAVSGDEVDNKKPAPDVYERVLQIAGFKPEEAAAVEDSGTGVKAAKNAGIYCYGYKNETSGNQNLTDADSVIMNLEDIINQ